MYRLETKNKPRSKLVREQAYGPGCVRVYRASTEDIMLQMWCPNGRYTLVALSPAEARAVAEELVAVADSFLTPLEPGELEHIVTTGD